MNRKQFIQEMVLEGNFNGDTMTLRLPDVLRIADKLFGKKEIKNDIMEDIKPCPHGRPNPQSCPHCMGWNFPKNN